MKLPKKITPDRIRDSIVQIFFTTDIPFDPLVGYLYAILGEMNFVYTNQPLLKQHEQLATIQPNQVVVNFALPQFLFYNEEIKIQLHQLNQSVSLGFNCINKYIGWERFSKFICDVIAKLFEEKILFSFTRIGVRYISEFPNIDLLNKLNISFSMKDLDDQVLNASFRVECKDDPYKIIVNLGTKLPFQAVTSIEGIRVDFVSLIDIDVIHENFNTESTDELFDQIDKIHGKQKEIFFGLLKEEFLQTLNPVYD